MNTMYIISLEFLAGAAGFEPANVDSKNRCLTTWRRPNILILLPYIINVYYRKLSLKGTKKTFIP